MKRIFLSVAILAIGLGVLTRCGDMPGKYADVQVVLKKMISAGEDYIEAVEKAGSAEDYAAAVNSYAAAMEKIKPRMEALSKKYPEFKTTPPDELKPLTAKLGEVMGRVMQASMKMTQYAQDPAVMKATQRMQTAMGAPGETQEPPPPAAETPVDETPAETAPEDAVEDSSEPAAPTENPDTKEPTDTAGDTGDVETTPAPAEETTPEPTPTEPAPAEPAPEAPTHTTTDTPEADDLSAFLLDTLDRFDWPEWVTARCDFPEHGPFVADGCDDLPAFVGFPDQADHVLAAAHEVRSEPPRDDEGVEVGTLHVPGRFVGLSGVTHL